MSNGNSGILFALANVVLISGAGALIPSASAQTSSTTTAQTTAQAEAARAHERAITDRYLTTVHTELASRIDTRDAKTGQQVAVRVLDDAQLVDGTRIPKGTRLLGQISLVQPQTGERAGALLVLTFDRAEIKGGSTIPVRSVIEMVTPASGMPAAMGANTMGGGMDAGPMSTGGNVGMGGSTRTGLGGGGGVLGNVGRGIGGRNSTDPLGRGSADPMGGGGITPMGGAGTPIGAGGTSTTGMGGTPIDISGRDSIGAAGPIGSRPIDTIGDIPTASRPTTERPVLNTGESISGTARLTGLPGVLLSRSGAPDASGVLTAMGRNITLESGTRVTLGVIKH